MSNLRLHLAPGLSGIQTLGVGSAEELFESSELAGGRSTPLPPRAGGGQRIRFPLPGTPESVGGPLTARPEGPRGAGTGWVVLERWNRAAWGELFHARLTHPRSTSQAERAWNLLCHLRENGVGTPQPLAVCARGSGLVSRDSFLVTREVGAGESLRDWLVRTSTDPATPSPTRRRGLRALGALLSKLVGARVELPRLAAVDIHVHAPEEEDECSSDAVALRRNRMPSVVLMNVAGGRLRDAWDAEALAKFILRFEHRDLALTDRERLLVLRLALAHFPRAFRRSVRSPVCSATLRKGGRQSLPPLRSVAEHTGLRTDLRTEIRAQLRLALPVILVQVGMIAMGQVDVAFLGRVDALEMAGAALGHSATFLLLIFGMGALSALDPVVGQAWGARDHGAVARGLQRGILLALLFSIPIAALTWPIGDVLAWAGVEPDVARVAGSYARITLLSVPAFLIFVAFRQVLQALHLMRPLVITILLANALNFALDWLWIDGNLGFEAMGARGSAWATSVSRYAMMFLLPLFALGGLRRYLWPLAPRVTDPRALWRMLILGLPIGLQWTVELAAFACVALLMGRLGENELAGHQVTLQIASLAFMIPLGISMAAAVRVGNGVGRGDVLGVRRAARVALVGGAGVMVLSALLFVAVPEWLVRVYVADGLAEVRLLAVSLLPVAALFQVFDGVQVVAVGILRGLGDTRIPMLLHLLGFWGIGLPVGWYLVEVSGLGPAGLWWGLAAGLGAVSVAQFQRLKRVLRGKLLRVVIDASDAAPVGPAA